MKVLNKEQADQIVDESLADFLPEATRLTYNEFCSDCRWKREGCSPCRTARNMIRVYLSALIEAKARLN